MLALIVSLVFIPLGIWAAVVLSRPAKPARPARALRATEVQFPIHHGPTRRYYSGRRSLPFGWTPAQATMVGLGAASVAHMLHEHHESERIQAYWDTEHINEFYGFGHHNM